MARKSKESVDDFIAKLDEPLKAQVQAVLDIIKGVNPAITEIVKWNAPSYIYNTTAPISSRSTRGRTNAYTS